MHSRANRIRLPNHRAYGVVKDVMQFIRIDLRKLQILGFRRLQRLAFGLCNLGVCRCGFGGAQRAGGPPSGFKQQAGDEVLYPRGINARAAGPFAAFPPTTGRNARLIGIEMGFQ